MASLGCQVFAFDPTVNHPTEWKPNVKFFPWGIRNSAEASTSQDGDGDGDTTTTQQQLKLIHGHIQFMVMLVWVLCIQCQK